MEPENNSGLTHSEKLALVKKMLGIATTEEEIAQKLGISFGEARQLIAEACGWA